MPLLKLLSAIKYIGDEIIYMSHLFIITAQNRRYYRSTTRLSVQDGLAWVEDPFYPLQAKRTRGVFQ